MSPLESENCYWGHQECSFTIRQLDFIASRTVKCWKRILRLLNVSPHHIDIIVADSWYMHDSVETSFKGYLKWHQISPKKASRCRLRKVLIEIGMLNVLEELEADHQNEDRRASFYHSKPFTDIEDDGSCIGREEELNEILKFASDESRDKHLMIVAIPGLGKQELFKQALPKICKQNPSKKILFPTLYATAEDKDGLENLLGNIYEEIHPGVCLARNRREVVTQLLSDISEPTILALDVSSVNMNHTETQSLIEFIERVIRRSNKLKIIHLRCKPPDCDVSNVKQIVLNTVSKEASIEMLQFHNPDISERHCIRVFNCCNGYPYMLRKIAAHINNLELEELENFINELELNPDQKQLKRFLTPCLKDDLKILFEQLDDLEKETLIQLSHFNELIPIDSLKYIFHLSVSITALHLWSNHCLLERSTCTRYYEMGSILRNFVHDYCQKPEENSMMLVNSTLEETRYSKLYMDSRLEVIRCYLNILKEFDILYFDPSSLHSSNCQQLRNKITNYRVNCNICSSKCFCEMSPIIISLFQKLKPRIILFLKKGFSSEETLTETVDISCRAVHFLKNLLPHDEMESLYLTNFEIVVKTLKRNKLRLSIFKATLVFIKVYQNLKEDQDQNINDLTQVIKVMENRFGQLSSSMLHQLSLCYINRGYLRGFDNNQFKQGKADINYGTKLLKKLTKKGRYFFTEFSSNGYMAAIYYQQQLFKQSIEKRNLQIDAYRKHLGNHAFTAKALHYQAQAYFKINEYDESIKCCWDAYNMYCKLRGSGVEKLRVIPTLAKNVIKTKKVEEGILMLRQAITEGVNKLGEHERVAWCYKELAVAIEVTDPQKAQELNLQANEIMKQYHKNSAMKNKKNYVLHYKIDEIDLNCFGDEDGYCSYIKVFIPVIPAAFILLYYLANRS